MARKKTQQTKPRNKQNTNVFYYANPERAFREGYYLATRQKRYERYSYVVYHYFLPENLIKIRKFLLTYFQTLDRLCDIWCDLHKVRLAPVEYVDEAIEILYHIQRCIDQGECLVAGSSQLSFLPWATFGISDRDAKYKFKDMKSIFKHYEKYMFSRKNKKCSVFKVYRPPHIQEKGRDKLPALAMRHSKSINYMLSVSLLLLFDLVKHHGPDNFDFRRVCTNKIQRCHEHFYTGEDLDIWKSTRATLRPPQLNISDTLVHSQQESVTHSRQLYKGSSMGFGGFREKERYSNIKIKEVESDSLIDGCSFTRIRNILKKKSRPIWDKGMPVYKDRFRTTDVDISPFDNSVISEEIRSWSEIV